MKRREFVSAALGMILGAGIFKSNFYKNKFHQNPFSEWLFNLSMDVEEVDIYTKHIPNAIMSVGKTLDFLEENLDVKAKYTFFVTEKCATDSGVISALNNIIKSYGDRIYIASHGSRHASISKLSKEETIEFVRASKASLDSLRNRLEIHENIFSKTYLGKYLGIRDDAFSIRIPAHSNNPHLLVALEKEIDSDIILFNTVYNPEDEITKNSFNPNLDLTINNLTPMYFPFHHNGHRRILQIPLTLQNLSAHALGYYSTKTRLKDGIKYFIDNVKYAEKGNKKYKFLTQYVHSHDVVEEFNDRFLPGNVVGGEYNYSCLDAFTRNLVEIISEKIESNQINSVKFLSPPEFERYAITFEDYYNLRNNK